MVYLRGKHSWKNNTILFFLLLSLAAFITYWQALSFTFSKDDWGLLWGSLHDLSIYPAYAIHPATPIEFFILAHIFGAYPFMWQVFGILLRVILAFVVGKFVLLITKSKKVSMLSSIFVAVSYAGIESIHFISGHATALSFFFLLTGIYFWVKYIQKMSDKLVAFLVCTAVGFFLDPGRAIPIFIILPLLYVLFSKRRVSIQQVKKYMYILMPLVITGGAFFAVWYITQSTGSQLAIFLTRFSHNPVIFFQKLYLLGNYFGSIGNLIIGWVIPNIQDAQNTGTYSRVIGRVGIFFLLFTLVMSYAAIFEKKSWRVFAFFLLWTFIWFIPDWLFEPRTPMAGAHRYLLISGIGFNVCLAWVVSRIKNVYLFLIIAVFIIVSNVVMVQKILFYQSTFRSLRTFQAIWEKVNKDVGEVNAPYIFVFEGNEPYLSLSVRMTSGIPFSLMRNTKNQQNIPMLLEDPHQIVPFLCTENVQQIGRTRHIIQKAKIPLTHIFAWEIISPSIIRSYSQKERNVLKAYAKEKGCML